MEAPMQPDYLIFRDEFNPTELCFLPPQDSDELFDVLRAKFPYLKRHSDRVRSATIEFFMMEQQQIDVMSSPLVPTTASTSPWQQSWPSVSATTSSSFNSPELQYVDTSTSASPQPPTPQTAATSTTTSTPQLDQMTGVFSLTSSQPKQHVRRKMTEAEKIEYRKRRIVKACDTCAKRKRKCSHNQPAMASVPSRNDKVTKDRAPPSARQSTPAAVPEPVPLPDMAFFDDQFLADWPLFDGATNMLDDSLFDDIFDYGAQPAPAEPQRVPSAFAPHTANNASQRLQRTESRRSQQHWFAVDYAAAHDNANQAPTPNESPRVSDQPSQERPVPTHTSHTHEFVGFGAYQYDGNSGSGSLNGTGADIARQQTTPRVKTIRRDNAHFQDGNAAIAATPQVYDQASPGAHGNEPTSLSVSSSSSARASPQERPSRREHDAFASSITRAADPRTELYMLRRRGMPNLAKQNIVAMTARAVHVEGHAIATAQGLAGLDFGLAQDLRSGATQDASPVHTRGRNPSDSGSAGGRQNGMMLATSTLQAPSIDRLRDTNRHKDHHGRHVLLQVLAMVVTAAVALTFLGQSALLLFLATCVPVSTRAPVASQRKEKSKDIMAPLASLMQTLQV